MKFREFFRSKAITLCFLGIGGIIITVFLLYSKVSLGLIGIAIGFLALLVICWLVCNYLVERSKLSHLFQLQQQLTEPYLLGELLPLPNNLVERQYYEVMKIISRSAIGIVEQSVREKEEYCDYVESWIHEIKTPLTACSLILANDADPRKLKRELKRADNLTESILYYARMRSVERDNQIQRFQVAPVINEAVKSQMELLIAANVSIDVSGDFMVYSDQKPLCFILKQLLINSAKYSPGCHIVITAENGTITVEDNGIGIPKHELGRGTERGFTGTNGRRLGGSTGMGLYLVKELCNQLEISLEIQSEPSKYTRISFTFPNLTKM